MFTTLPESRSIRQRRIGGFTVSTVVHAASIALAVRATAWTAPSPKSEPIPTVVWRVPTTRTSAPPASRELPPRGPARRSDGALSPAPPPIGPIDIVPPELPPPGAMAELIRSNDFQPSGSTSGGAGNTGTSTLGSGPAVFEEPFVDRAIVAIPGTSTPRYPATLRSAGVEGDVRARFVVDTLGRVEPASIRILDATHDLFARAVRDALARARFVPAEAGGRRVRQLAEQSFTFRLTPNR